MAVPAVVNLPFIKLPQGSRLPEDFGLIRGPPAFPNPAAGDTSSIPGLATRTNPRCAVLTIMAVARLGVM